ncbi:MAG: AAA family ATPase [Bacteroidaceae bacterium]|nr:AAA family ATPase [Bacteroidaceae bacterium]
MISPTPQQSDIFAQIKDFLSNESDIFVLRGYAGTGKTTLIGEICKYLKESSLLYSVLAPTGRAAKVLREKVGNGKSIHSEIYSNELQCIIPEDGDDSKKSYRYIFPLISTPNDTHTIIVDESSMISDMIQSNEFLQFGSGKLLSDLLKYFKTTGCRKLIFVGDEAQLPPVGDNHSRALDTEDLQSRGFRVESNELTEVIRQKSGSSILHESTKIRMLLQKPLKERDGFEINSNETDIIELSSLEKTNKYVSLYPQPELGNGVIILYSNKACFNANKQIRELMYGADADLQVGDVLLINNNNYRTFGREIYNGDMAKVTKVGDIEHRSVPVTIDGKKNYVELRYRDVELLFPKENGHQIISCKILMNLLESKERDISRWEMRALYIDFCIRHPKLREGSGEFKEVLIHDFYFNSLKVKYGYAITCHKAQGGEWDTVFVDYSGRIGLSDDALRWCYTATTRAKKTLYTINAPCITSFSDLIFKSIIRISKSPSCFFHEDSDLTVDYMSRTALIGTRLKCKGFIDEIKDIPYELVSVQPFQYQDRYIIRVNDNEEKQVILTTFYDGNGIYKRLATDSGDKDKDTLSTIFNKALFRDWSFPYSPSAKVYEDIYHRMLCECESVGVMITNIVEETDKCFVTYNLITDACFACIQFYVSNGRLSTAIPRSESGDSDYKLLQLIKNLQ